MFSGIGRLLAHCGKWTGQYAASTGVAPIRILHLCTLAETGDFE
jgi:hypothetical protein